MILKDHMSAEEYRNSVSGTAADPRRQLRGAQSRNAGLTFEDKIKKACEMYANRRAAFVEKTPEPMKVLRVIDRRRGYFEACYEKRAQPDFKGLLAGGREVCFEAKHTDGDRMPQSYVTDEQRDALNMHAELGAWCFVLVSIGMQEFFRVPWDSWKSMKDIFGHKYMTAEEMERWRVPVVGGMILFLSGGGAP